MNDSTLYRYGAGALIAAGIATAAFWLLVTPFDSFAGPETPLHPLFAPAQIAHIIGSVLLLFGYTALYLHIRKSAALLGGLAYVIAMLGAVAVFGDGVLGLVIFPTLARHAPDLTIATGPMFTGRVLGFYIGFFATNMIGVILLGSALIRTKFPPRPAALLLIIGGIFSNLPPAPALHLLLVAGGVAFGAALVWLGFSLRRLNPASEGAF